MAIMPKYIYIYNVFWPGVGRRIAAHHKPNYVKYIMNDDKDDDKKDQSGQGKGSSQSGQSSMPREETRK